MITAARRPRSCLSDGLYSPVPKRSRQHTGTMKAGNALCLSAASAKEGASHGGREDTEEKSHWATAA